MRRWDQWGGQVRRWEEEENAENKEFPRGGTRRKGTEISCPHPPGPLILGVIWPLGGGVMLSAQEKEKGAVADTPETWYLLLFVLQSAPQLFFSFIDHGHPNDRIKLLELGEKVL